MKRSWVPLLTLLVGLTATVAATWFVAHYFEVKANVQFNDAVQEATEAIQTRIESYIALLRGCSGLFAVRRNVTTGEFHAFVNRLQVPRQYAGLQGIGYAPRTSPENREALVTRMHSQGAPDFKIWPEGQRQEYFPILFLEPQDRRNQAALGYDMLSEPVRRTAIEKARDSGGPIASGRVTLVQEIEGPLQAGFLIYIPLYWEGDVPATLAERKATLQGVIYSPFRADDLFREIIDADLRQVFALRVYDETAQATNLMHNSAANESHSKQGRFRKELKMEIAGRPWWLQFDSQTAFEAQAHGGRIPLLVFLLGVVLSLLLFYYTNAEARARQTAEQYALRVKRSREALRESEERFRLMVDSARDYGIMTLDSSGTVLSWNSGAEQLYRYAPNEIVGRNFSTLFTPEDRSAGVPQKELAQAVDTGRAEDDRWLLIKGGEKRFVSGISRAIRDEFGNVQGLIKITRDITERWQAEENLRKEREFTDAIVQSLPGIFYLFDRHGKTIYWNRTLEQVTGYSREQIAAMTVKDFIAEELREEVVRKIEGVLQRGQGSMEADLQRKDGGRVPYFFTGQRVELDRGTCVVGMGVDITERRRSEEALRQARDELSRHARDLERLVKERTAHLEQSLGSLEGILYHVAHDLRAPLRAMHGFTSILLKEYAPHFDATGEEYTRRISEAAGRMDRLICDLLEYGRLAHVPLPLGAINLQEPLRRVLGDLQAEIQAKHADIEVEMPLPVVWANGSALEAILSNLLSNALKFVRPGAKPRIRVAAKETQETVHLSVEDNGMGIDPKYQDRVFRVFERLHNTDQYPGTGIGLAIVHKAAQRLNATVGLQSTLGQGSTFWVDLPRANPKAGFGSG
jgi:PAS domain S-box-containing protein